MEDKIRMTIQRAREVACEYNPKTLVPFPLEEVIRKGGIDLLYVDTQLKPEAEGMSGAIYYRKSTQKYTILVNRDDSAKRRYFTIAHELGHFFLHRKQINDSADSGLVDSADGFDGALFRGQSISPEMREVELEANIFASELIMPERKLREAVVAIGDNSVETYAELFEVSIPAMAVRMERLGLL